jgi:hypothetical protein
VPVVNLSTDDDVHRFAGRWIEVRGSVLPFQARYSAWATFLAAWLLAAPLLMLVLAPPRAVFNGALLAAVVAVGTMRFVSGDLGLLGLTSVVTAETRTWLRTRRSR